MAWGAPEGQPILLICDSRHSASIGAGIASSSAHDVRMQATAHMQSPKFLGVIGVALIIGVLFVLLFALALVAKLTMLGQSFGGASPASGRRR